MWCVWGGGKRRLPGQPYRIALADLPFRLFGALATGQELYGITFQYHMYNGLTLNFGTATLESSADGVDFTALWTKSGNQGDQWNQATVFTPTGGHKWLRFTCVPNCC